MEGVRSDQERGHHTRSVGEQNDLQAQDLSYHCDIQTPEQFGDLFWVTTCQRKADLYEELVFACDEAVWIWKLAEAVFGQDTPAYHDWLEQARTELWEGDIESLIHHCQLFASIPAAIQAVHAAVAYFTHTQKRMDLPAFVNQAISSEAEPWKVPDSKSPPFVSNGLALAGQKLALFQPPKRAHA